MWNRIQQDRLDDISSEIKRMTGYKAADLSDKQAAHLKNLVDEGQELMTQRANYKAALGLAGSSDPHPNGNPADGGGDYGFSLASRANKGVINDPREQKAAEHGLAARKHIMPSPYLMSDKQMRDIYAAGRSNMSFGTTIGKGADGN